MSTDLSPARNPRRKHQSKHSSKLRNRRNSKREESRALAIAEPQKSDSEPRAKPAHVWKKPLDWPVVLWLGLLHVGALAAPFFFTWKGLGVALFLYWLTGSLGICLGFHRLLTHGSFQTWRPVKWFFAWLGGLAGEGPALMWVAVHRKHHVFSDTEHDPHTPRDGAWWSHMLWLAPDRGSQKSRELIARYAPDLNRDPVMRFLDKSFIFWPFVVAAALFSIGYFGWDAYTGWSLLVWGVFARMVFLLHVTWLVNSASHIWGYRNYETTDDSRNCWWVGLLAFGEGWHNNHHAYQRMARHGHRWYEVDVTYWAIWLMEKCGLAWRVVKDVRGRPALS